MEKQEAPFSGFEPLNSNYVYCPNQFFDVCIPHCSRGAVRIIAYVLRQTLGWLDENGVPLRQEIQVSYSELIERAGVSRGAIGPALQEAVDAKFIRAVQRGSPKSRRNSGRSAKYSLRWDDGNIYTNDPAKFAGLFSGEGNRTPVPNQFFDRVVCLESLAVTKVVGTVIRQTVGYQNQFGGRRTSHPLSFTAIQRLSKIGDRKTVTEAIRLAQQNGFIECVEQGCFSHKKSQRRPAVYRVHWLQNAENSDISSKSPPASYRFKNPTSIGSEIPPADRFKNPTSNKRKAPNESNKQQSTVAAELIGQLVKQGIDQHAAGQLVEERGVDVVGNQLGWVDARHPRDNRPGLLRKAIEENWEMPASIKLKMKRDSLRKREAEQKAHQVSEDSRIIELKRERLQRKNALQQHWDTASREQRSFWIRKAAKFETSKSIAEIIRRQNPSCKTPRIQVLDIIAREQNLPPILATNSSDDWERCDRRSPH
ncbi:hypothetical protein [Rubinisphaera italica]|uniref:Uncharacterized protein n=1 Tax=Rubinisphaera italica TaxID=2527969 RepID=A0A5C5XDU8_9PLAN|nr:hypothetical protein [Rubinisphaera italica]TWT60988.1 hypothetical protein Pan54_17200 [Rubinisphaera italica]